MTDADFLVEVVAADARAVEDFVDQLHIRFRVGYNGLLYVLEDSMREGYLTDALRYPERTGVTPSIPLAAPSAAASTWVVEPEELRAG